ncbi:TonB-dependent receptor [Massilia sp. GER05]|uniref:TonB-dependent receptor n=1 Tax=Massilia sp. GER05 TaxID=3394605 RepID=UPI003F8596EC
MATKTIVTGCASLISFCIPAYAQQDAPPAQPQAASTPSEAAKSAPAVDNGAPQQVLVSASKNRPQIMVEAPMSIQAFTGKELASKNITNLDALVSAVPGASQGEQLGEFIRSYSIRGSGAGGGIGDALVGYYIDETAYVIPNAQFAPPLRLMDIAQVEVLRGPYGTLYGQGAMGGTMIFRTKNPNLKQVTGDAETYIANVEGSSGLSYGAAAAVSIPLIKDTLGLRISGGGDSRAGYADVYSGDPTGTPRVRDANKMHKSDARVVLYWVPNENFKARLQYMHFGGKQDYSQQMTSVDPSYLANWGDVQGYEKSRNDLYSLSMEYDLGFATLTSATGVVEFDTSYLSALAVPVLGSGPLFNGYTGNSFTQELRLASNSNGPLHWVVGAYYNNAKNRFDQSANLTLLTILGATTTKTRNKSIFGEMSYDLFDGKLVPLLGLRQYKDNRTFISESIIPKAPDASGNASPSVTTWRANLAYHPDGETTAYLNAGTGFRSGIAQSPLQVNALRIDNIIEGVALNPDRVRNLEIGIKGSLRQARLSYEANLYKLQYNGLQTGLYTSSGIAAFASLGNATVKGIDLALQWTPMRGLNLGFAGDLNNAKYNDVNPLVARGIGSVVYPGAQLLNTPRFTTRLDANYSRPVNETWTAYANGSVSRSGSRMNQAGDETAIFNLVDASLGLRSKTYEVELYGQNLGDARGPWFIRQAGLIGGPVPRTIGIRGRYHF